MAVLFFGELNIFFHPPSLVIPCHQPFACVPPHTPPLLAPIASALDTVPPVGSLSATPGSGGLQLLSQPERFCAHDLANIAWAIAKLDRDKDESEALLAAVERRGKELANDFSPQGIASMVWAFSSLRRTSPGLLDALEAPAIRAASGGLFSAQGLAMVLRGYVALRGASGCSEELLAALAEEAVKRSDEFTLQGLRCSSSPPQVILCHSAPPSSYHFFHSCYSCCSGPCPLFVPQANYA